MNVQAIMQWLSLLSAIEARGEAAYAAIKQAMADHGIEADTAALDAVIADAARRKALAEREAGISDVAGAIVTGNTGE